MADESVLDTLEVTTSAEGATQEAPTSSKNLTVETKTYRTYGTVVLNDKSEETYKSITGKNADGTPKYSDNLIVAQKTAEDKAWTNAAESGNTMLTENQFQFYTLENLAGFDELIPDAEQRLYIVQKGILALQTQKANAMQKELAEAPATGFAYTDQVIDLRDALNEPPQRQKGNPAKKILGMLSALPAEEVAKLMAALAELKNAQ